MATENPITENQTESPTSESQREERLRRIKEIALRRRAQREAEHLGQDSWDEAEPTAGHDEEEEHEEPFREHSHEAGEALPSFGEHGSSFSSEKSPTEPLFPDGKRVA